MRLFIILILVSGISCTLQAPPEVINTKSPNSFSVKVNPDSCFLFMLKKDNGFYVDHLNGNKSDTITIIPFTKANIIGILDSTEQKHHIKLIDYAKVLIVEEELNSTYPSFKILKEAFKEKEIYKFRIVTTAD